MSSPTRPLPRRPALGLAGAVAVAVVVVLAALAANLGLLNAAPSAAGKVGQLDGNNVASLVANSSAVAGPDSGSGSASVTSKASGEPDVGRGVEPAVDHDDDVATNDSHQGGDNDD
jgi:hypothetical protein